MNDHKPRWILNRPPIRAHLAGHVLSVDLLGRFTPARLHSALHALRVALHGTDYHALVINAQGAQMAVTLPQLAALWGEVECPLAARPCAILIDGNHPETTAFYEALGVRLAAGQPARVIGAFSGALMVSAVHWAQKRGANFRSERERQELRASSRASSGKRVRKRAVDPDHS